MKKISVALIGILMLVVLAACGGGVPKAAAIDPDKDICEICKMAVKDNQFATQIILADKKVLKFDDLGCMAQWLKENKDEDIAVKYVRDYKSKKWIDYDEATYVYNADTKTPMSYGVISFEKAQEAKDFAAKHEGSEVMTAKELKDHKFKMNNMGGMNTHTH